jgi:N-acetylglucosaminyldiphosphoundecaprenol N-acetyl-beta-D-mannosaminyltransferase
LKRPGTFNVFGIEIDKLTNETFLNYIREGINSKDKLTIGYANADTLNKIYEDSSLKDIYNSFELIHPDGIGIYLASGFLFGKNGLEERLTGSDFYPILINESIKNNWKYFFFGHTDSVLEEIQKQFPLLNISGTNEGYKYDNSSVIEKINLADPDIIIIGLSCPYQEKWMYENRDKINFKVMLAVGDGIRVFANKKTRGPVLFRKLGLEWLARLVSNPSVNFRKYVTGIPLFISRITTAKLKSK